MAKNNIETASLDETKMMHERGDLRHDPDAPIGEILSDTFWKTARIVEPQTKKSVHLRLDQDVLDWFRGQGKGHLTRMNAVLRAYMLSHDAEHGK